MASVEITISGVLFDKINRTSQPVVLIGEASLTGLSVGGGPIAPPSGGGQPPGIWPGPGHPAHPIWLPGVWPEPQPPHPAHPIVLPPEGGKPPTEPPVEPPTQPADPQWVWGWSPQHGWHPVYTPGPGGKPQPVPPPSK